MFVRSLLLLAAPFLAWVAPGPSGAIPAPGRRPAHAADDRDAAPEQFIPAHLVPSTNLPGEVTPCVGGAAGGYPCNGVDLAGHLPLSAMGGAHFGNDCWGWTDPRTGHEYALMGLSTGTAFVDITVAVRPIWLGSLPTHTENSDWRDIKVYRDHAYIVSEADDHGMQVFDLRQLRNVPSPPVTFTETAHYDAFGWAHNIVINEETGFAYAVGSDVCSGGLLMIDISTPESPVPAGCFAADGYTHDAQVVIYHGPDTAHDGDEIAFAYNEDSITIVDVTNKAAPVQLSRSTYSNSKYTHQGWLTDDQRYLIMNDEEDEETFGHNTLTRIWDVLDLENPALIGVYVGPTAAIDHNLYVKGDLVYEANYRAGLRILDLAAVAAGELTEVAFFDIYPSSNSARYNGAWSLYPYYESGTVIVSGIEQGLFVLRPHVAERTPEVEPPALSEEPAAATTAFGVARPNPFVSRTEVEFELAREERMAISVYDATGRRVRMLHEGTLAAGPHVLGWDGRDDSGRAQAAGVFLVRIERPDGDAETRKVLLLR